MRAVEVEPGEGEIELPEDEFDDLLLPRWTADTSNLHRVGFDLRVAVRGGRLSEIVSPSHTLRTQLGEPDTARVGIALAGDVPNRDLVLDVRSHEPICGAGSVHSVR